MKPPELRRGWLRKLVAIKRARQTPDVVVTGARGLYAIRFDTVAAYKWFQENMRGGPHTWYLGALVCDGTDRCKDIVAGMDRSGLRVVVNGVSMKGFGAS